VFGFRHSEPYLLFDSIPGFCTYRLREDFAIFFELLVPPSPWRGCFFPFIACAEPPNEPLVKNAANVSSPDFWLMGHLLFPVKNCHFEQLAPPHPRHSFRQKIQAAATFI
jgi:hypothetical protein